MKLLGIYFLYPKWLWIAALVPLFYFGGLVLMKWRKEGFRKFADEAIWKKIAPDLDWNLPKRKLLVWCFAVFFLFLALARPQWGETEETLKTTGLDIMLIVDVSQSMLTEDVIPNRLKKSQHFIRRLLERAEGDRVGLVAFAGNSILLSPLTTDLGYVAETVENLTPDSVTAQGTDIGAGLETALKALERGAEDNSAKETQAPVTRSVILISDGEDNEDRINEMVSQLKKENLKFFSFGVGTEKGGTIPIRDPGGLVVGAKRDRSGQSVVSKFNPASLEKLARDAGGKFWRITPSENELDELMADLGSLARGDFTEKKVTIRHERFQWPLALSLLFFFLDLAIPSRRLAAAALMLAVSAGLGGSEAKADTLRAYQENERALQAFSEEKISEAKDHFSNAQVEAPKSPELRFNQGAIHLKEEKFEDAAKVYGEAATAAQLNQRPEVAAAALYNQGIARTLKKDLEGAVDSYLAALEQNAHRPNPELEGKIRKNLELLFSAKQSQGKGGESKDEKEKSDEEKKDQGDDKDGKNSNDGDQDKKKDPKDGEGKDKPKQFKESNGKREFKSQKLSKEDANRVMSELARREKDLQDKMKRAKGRPQPLEKDW
jgi:Ca-activated chloride channel family protein